MDDDSGPPPPSTAKSKIRGLKWAARGIILLLVVWGILHAVQRARHDLQSQRDAWDVAWTRLQQEQRELETSPDASRQRKLDAERDRLLADRVEWWRISPLWLGFAGIVYLVAGLPCWVFWHQTLQALEQRPAPWDSLRAYWIGHLGKYVPGKALVVLLRAGLVRGPYVDGGIAAIAVFVETLTMMAVGAAWSVIMLLISLGPEQQQAWLPWAIVLMLGAGFPTIPPFFRQLVVVIQKRRGIETTVDSLRGINARRMLQGWMWMSLSWVLMGLSLWATLRALPGDSRTVWESLGDLPAIIACAALAVVLGFASLLPGGVGVRELVVVTLLAPLPDTGAAKALVAALLVRMVWLLAEVVISIILYAAPFSRRGY